MIQVTHFHPNPNPQEQEKPINIHQNTATTNFITSIWNKKLEPISTDNINKHPHINLENSIFSQHQNID